MILLDTHILVWWLNQELDKLSEAQLSALQNAMGIAISAISLWEIAKLVEHGRLILNMPVLDWINIGLARPNIQAVPLTPEIIVQSTTLPGTFHKDPADQLIVATAMRMNLPLLTKDSKILDYPHIFTLG